MNDPNEFGPPEPILNLRKKSVMRMLQKFDSSGEDNDRGTKRRHSDSVDADEEMTEEERINREAKKAAVMDEDPPARERPAFHILRTIRELRSGWEMAKPRSPLLYPLSHFLRQWIRHT